MCSCLHPLRHECLGLWRRLLLFALVWLAGGLRAQPAAAPDLAALLDQNRWFELRDAVQQDRAAPPLYRGAVASVFNDEATARTALAAAIQADPASDAAIDAHNLLCALYHRQERRQPALAEIEAILKAHPDNPGAQQARPMLAALATLPDLTVVRWRESRMAYERKQKPITNWFVPAVVQGRPQRFLMDTGASASLLSVSEARRLGLKIASLSVSNQNAAGQPLTLQLAVADTLRLGDCELHGVVFQLLPDDVQPFSLLQPGERGILGLPVMLALRTLRWDADGMLTVAFPARRYDPAKANLCFQTNMPLTLARCGGKPVVLELDTGGGSSFLYPGFARDFPELLQLPAAHHKKFSIGGVGGQVDGLDSVVLPSVTLNVGGKDLLCQPATVQLTETDQASRRFHGLLGLPLLSQARRITLDFQAMRLELE